MECVKNLHINKITHFDIKPGNIFVLQELSQYFLNDFGGCIKVFLV